MAPEQLRGEGAPSQRFPRQELSLRDGHWRRPFDGKLVMAVALDIQTKPPARPSQLQPRMSPGLEHIILKCLEKDPDLRYQSARDLLADIRRLGAPVPPGQVATVPRTRLGGRALELDLKWGRARLPAWLIALLALVVGPFIWLIVKEVQRQPGVPQTSPPGIIHGRPCRWRTSRATLSRISEGMHEALITELSKISALRVISRTSTLRYKGSERLLAQIAKDLNVDAILEGSVLRAGNRLRVSAQLIQVNPERHLWADNFDRELTDVLYLTSDVAQTVARQIRVMLTPAEEANLARARPVNPEAYELYAVGRHHWNQRTMDGYRQAIESFRKALELDGGYAPVYAALADSYILLGEQGGLPQNEARSQAGAAIRKALELDPNLPEAHASLGHWKFYYEWNWAESEQAFKRAIGLNAGYAPAHQLYGRTLGFLGRFDDALGELKRARELDPLSITINAYIGQVHLFARHYDQAAEQLQWTLALNPNHALVRHNLGELHLAQGRFAEAITQLEKSVALSREPSAHYTAILGCTYARGNRRADALWILDELTQRSKQGLVSAFDLASLHAALGDKEQSLAWLERGYEKRDYWLVELKVWPWFDSLLPDPRFQGLLRRMNLSP
jgi:TolB-like protein/Tfp pilus assembly protein PilF